MSTTDRLRKLEDRLRLGACRQCAEFARSGFTIRMGEEDNELPATDANQTCPECGRPSPSPAFTIVFRTREDGPQ